MAPLFLPSSPSAQPLLSLPPSLASDRSPLLAANEQLSSRFHFRFYQCVPVARATAPVALSVFLRLPFRAKLLPPTPCGEVVSSRSHRPDGIPPNVIDLGIKVGVCLSFRPLLASRPGLWGRSHSGPGRRVGDCPARCG